ncbi:hypothetical protein [Qipengyuania mesophila]|uniref:hypothetical protein n=1 Tax=Qipengyuania mesophila TaxID=2867246 RepID=UPI003516448E
MKHFSIRLSLIALAAALPAMAQAQSASDFSLQPAPTPTATPQAQGPADTRAGVPIAPRAVNTPTPTPAATPTPQPSATPAAQSTRVSTAGPTPVPSPLPTVTQRAVATSPAQPQASALPPQADIAPETTAPQALPTSATPLPATTATATPQTEAPGEEFPWLPVAAVAGLLALLGAGFVAWQRRREAVVPEIERPVVASAGATPAASLPDALAVSIEHEKLIRSAAFATLKYRMTLANRTGAPLTQLAVGLDLVSAHAALPVEQQLATAATALERRHEIARIGPHQSVTIEGQVQLPLAQAHVIRQGRHPLLVPLLRVRIDGPGEEALVKTFVVGQGVPGGSRVQPFNLDEGPRSYAPIAQRELA